MAENSWCVQGKLFDNGKGKSPHNIQHNFYFYFNEHYLLIILDPLYIN